MKIERSELSALLGTPSPKKKPSSQIPLPSAASVRAEPTAPIRPRAASSPDLASSTALSDKPAVPLPLDTNVRATPPITALKEIVLAPDEPAPGPVEPISAAVLSSNKAPTLKAVMAEGASEVVPRFTEVHRELGFSLPNLWNHAKAKERTTKGQRQKLRTLLAWAATKKGWTAQERAPMRYSNGTDSVDGKVDLVVHGANGLPLLAVEIDWAAETGSLAKLKAAHEAGFPVLWVCGTPVKSKEDAKVIRKQTREKLGWTSGQWLLIYHLDFGWI